MMKRGHLSRPTRNGWFAQSWQYILLVVVAVVAAFLVALALTRPSPTFAPSSRVPSASPISPTPSETPTPTPTPTPSGPEAKPAVAFLGDSYTVGAGASSPAERWSTSLADDNGWTEINLGAEGTGYGTAGSATSFEERVERVIEASPSIVIVSGGRFDYSGSSSVSDISRAIAATFSGLRAGLPDAKIIALSPIWDATDPPARLIDIASEVRVEVEAVAGTYADIGQPLAGRPTLIAPDGVNPNDDGYSALGSAIEGALIPLVAPAVDGPKP